MQKLELSMLGAVVPQIFGALILLVGLILAVSMRQSLGRSAAGLAIAATALGILNFLAITWWQLFGVQTVIYDGGDNRYAILSIVNVLFGLLHLTWTTLLLSAVFVGRRRPPVVQTATLAPDSPL